jgi:hypothetical protein
MFEKSNTFDNTADKKEKVKEPKNELNDKYA